MAEHQVGLADTLLADGDMQRIELDGKPVVLARVQGEYYAFGGKCTHYGAPLNQGVLKGHSLICPWHHACFDIRSGRRLEPPALDDLPHYPVRVEDGVVIVDTAQPTVLQPAETTAAADRRHFVIVGGGAAGDAAAEELRRAGFTGPITLISAVPDTPVDRPNLSKDYLDGHAKPEWIPLRDGDWFAARDIQLRLNTRVTRIDPEEHAIYAEQGAPLHYDKLLLATGSAPRTLGKTPGADLKGIYTLRTLADADQIIEAAESGKRAVVVGASFIGMEVAASLAGGRGVAVTVAAPEPVPFSHVLGAEIGRMLQRLHEEHGVRFCLGTGVSRFEGRDGHVHAVELEDGTKLDADFVVLGVGVTPATDFLGGSGIALNDRDHSVRVDRHLQTNAPDVYAAGDIARWYDGSDAGIRIEHWRVAQQQGIVAARNMLGEGERVDDRVPFFWTMQWKLRLSYVGHASTWDDIIFWGGTPEDRKFIAFYLLNGNVQAAAGCGYDRELDAVELILRDRMPLSADQLRDPALNLVAYAQGGASAN